MADRINLYIVAGCKSGNHAEAIAEAREVAKLVGFPVELRQCGTQQLVCYVYEDGNISYSKAQGG